MNYKELAKELCKEHCHHLCNDTTDCVVEDEAKAIIGDNLPSTLKNDEKISEKEKQIEWISVEDRLPDKYKSVLISCEDEVRIDYIDAFGFWHDNYPYRVTHWMPLPEPPKMKGGE